MTSTPVSPMTTPLRVGALTAGGAILATALLWTSAQVLGIELRVDPRNGRAPGVISLPFIATLTLAVCLLGWGARTLLDRLTRRAPIIWAVLAVLVLLASFLPLLAVEAAGAAKAILALMHVAVAAVQIPVFSRRRS
ncbi:DUF6069 family protein [Micromonospora aurantiaca]|uniref:DUF6069 family protein n=1 Tax=Micromonospora aurantiaca (nom. illeg.) TaxID=47850 RepID=UPI0037F81B3C